MLRTHADRIGLGLLLLLILLVCGDLYLRMLESSKVAKKVVVPASSITTTNPEVDQSKADVDPVISVAEMKQTDLDEAPPKSEKRIGRKPKAKSNPVLYFAVPPSQPARTPDEVKTVLRSNSKFRNAMQEGLCVALNDFRLASGTMKVQIIVPSNGGAESVKVEITWIGDVKREFYSYDLSEQDRIKAAREVANTLTQKFKDVADEDLFPPRGGGDAVAATITRRFTWNKSTSDCDFDPNSGT